MKKCRFCPNEIPFYGREVCDQCLALKKLAPKVDPVFPERAPRENAPGEDCKF